MNNVVATASLYVQVVVFWVMIVTLPSEFVFELTLAPYGQKFGWMLSPCKAMAALVISLEPSQVFRKTFWGRDIFDFMVFP